MKEIFNTTPHKIVFLGDDREFEIPPSGVVVNAKIEETIVREDQGVIYVKSVFSAEELPPLPDNAICVGSIIAAQAYPGRIFGLTPAKGYERVPVSEKRMNPQKFITFE